jgi:hypothetical protein
MPDNSPRMMRSSEHDLPYPELALPPWASTTRLARVGEYAKAGNSTSSFRFVVKCLVLLSDRRRGQLGLERLYVWFVWTTLEDSMSMLCLRH